LLDDPLPVGEDCFLPLRQFERQMEYLARHFEVLHLEDAFENDRSRYSKPVACVTFDDGFASNHDLALPVLERLKIPATVYVVTDYVDTLESMWFTRVHQAICQTTASTVRVNGRLFPLDGQVNRGTSSLAVQRELQKFASSDFEEAFESVLSQLGYPEANREPPWKAFRMLTREQIRRMSRDDLVRFGPHTASHQILTRTSREDSQREIESSVAAVATMVERPSRSFAYPNGGPDDFDPTTIEDVKRAGIDYAVTTISGPNGPDTDPYLIKRYCVDNEDPLYRFVARVHHGSHMMRKILGKNRRS